jgi:hypothetical protein
MAVATPEPVAIDGVITFVLNVPIRLIVPESLFGSMDTGEKQLAALSNAFFTSITPMELLEEVPTQALAKNTGIYTFLQLANTAILHRGASFEDLHITMDPFVIVAESIDTTGANESTAVASVPLDDDNDDLDVFNEIMKGVFDE